MTTVNADQISYIDLYRRWEESPWSAFEVDFSRDREDWLGLADLRRAGGLWLYSLFLYGENAVTDGLSPYIEAAPNEEQRYFLATQQADEARHTLFFGRFLNEVLGFEGGVGELLERTADQLNPHYKACFERLEKMCEELHQDRSLPKFAQAICLYHIVLEAGMAQPSQYLIENHFSSPERLPGMHAGMKHVARDEQRHVAFGVKALSELFRASDECLEAVRELLLEVMMDFYLSGMPPDEGYFDAYGITLEEFYAHGMRAFEDKWRSTRVPLPELLGDIYPFAPEVPYEERARIQVGMLRTMLSGGVSPG